MQIFFTYIHTAWSLYIRNRYRYRLLMKELAAFMTAYQADMDASIKKRIWHYTLQSSLTNQWFTTLRGTAAAAHEIRAGLYLGAYTPLYDDLMDTEHYTHDQLTGTGKQSPQQQVLHYLLKKIELHISDTTLFRQVFEQLGQAQNLSLQQLQDKALPANVLQDITWQKGGYATLLYRSILDHPLKKGEQEAIFSLGGMLQLTNDIFDLYKDMQQGSQTLVTTAESMHTLAELFEEKLQHSFCMIKALAYAPAQTLKMLRQVAAILSRGKVCVEQYQSLQGNASFFDRTKFSRSQLICDMEKWKNIRRSLAICKQWEAKW